MRNQLIGKWSTLFIALAGLALAACGSDAVMTADGSVQPGIDSAMNTIDAPTAIDAPHAGADAAAVCDPVTQSGCTPPQACNLTSSGAPGCAPAGTTMTGGGCTTANACVAGDLCAEPAANTTGLCSEFCAADSDCKEPANGPAGNVGHCLLALNGTSFKLCTAPCNPVTAAGASGCPAPLACEYTGTTTIPELTNCSAAGTLAEGATCTSTMPCGAGLICIGSGTSGTCRQICRNATDTDCTAVATDTCTPPGGVTNPMFGFCCPAAGC